MFKTIDSTIKHGKSTRPVKSLEIKPETLVELENITGLSEGDYAMYELLKELTKRVDTLQAAIEKILGVKL